jgi:hypothetical protein
LSEVAADAERRWEVFDKEHREQFEEPTLLQTRGSKLCHAIVGPPRVRNHLSRWMRLAGLHHTVILESLPSLGRWCLLPWSRHSPNETFHVEVVGKLVVEFQRLEEWCSQLERPATRICDLRLRPPLGRYRLADRLDMADG